MHQFVLDTVHWTSQVYPKQTDPQRWKVGGISSSLVVDQIIRDPSKLGLKKRKRGKHQIVERDILPPSIRRRLLDVLEITESPTWMSKLPCVRTLEDVNAQTPLWKSVLQHLKLPQTCQHVTVSLNCHDDKMLTYGRKYKDAAVFKKTGQLSDVPCCALKDQCAALVYPGNQGPLPIYLMPSEQQHIERGHPPVVPFSSNATCLLCIRRDVHSAVLAWLSLLTNEQVQIQRGACIPPPFCNLVSTVGGYRPEAMINTEKHNCFGPVNIVGMHSSLKVRYNPATSNWYFDQSAIKFMPPSSFLCPGATTSM